MADLLFEVATGKEGEVLQVPANAIYHDASGDFPAMIMSERQSEITANLGDNRFRKDIRTVADLRVHFGKRVIRKGPAGNNVEAPEFLPVFGVALKDNAINPFTKAYYVPLVSEEKSAKRAK